jgi:predicted alpha/beta-hydrolase family hydrolase
VNHVLVAPPQAKALLVLAHGAGAGMRHPFLERIAQVLSERSIATYRYEFLYMEKRAGRPDPPAVAEMRVREAVLDAARVAPGLPIFGGGKSFGGRMTSQAQAREPLPGVRGLVFLGFPLHPPGRPATSRGDHLDDVLIPMLFLQGSRDEFAGLDLLEPIVKRLRDRATLHVIEGGDHSFKVLKRTGRTEADVMNELADTIAAWTGEHA